MASTLVLSEEDNIGNSGREVGVISKQDTAFCKTPHLNLQNSLIDWVLVGKTDTLASPRLTWLDLFQRSLRRRSTLFFPLFAAEKTRTRTRKRNNVFYSLISLFFFKFIYLFKHRKTLFPLLSFPLSFITFSFLFLFFFFFKKPIIKKKELID